MSNFVGKTPFAAVNLTFPVLMAVSSIGFMAGTGGSAVVSKTLGEGKKELANEYFSMIIAALFYRCRSTFRNRVCIGKTNFHCARCQRGRTPSELYHLYPDRIPFHAGIYFAVCVPELFRGGTEAGLKPEGQCGSRTCERSSGLCADRCFFHWGLAGAAIATSAGQIVGGLVPVIYFMRKNDSLLQLTKFHIDFKIIGKVCTNGSSEMVTNLSSSIVNILYNFQLMKLAGEDGIAAYGVIMYINIIFMSIFLGYSIGSAPIVSYHYGAGNHSELKNLFHKSLTFLMISGVLLLVASEALARPLSAIFVNYDATLLDLTVRGFRIYSLAFLIMGINVWGSSFFTALNDGLVSAVISFLRTLVFQIIVIMVLPALLGVDGIWFSIVAAEVMALFVTLGFLFTKRGKYRY